MSVTANPTDLEAAPDKQTPATTRRPPIDDFSDGLRWARSVLNDPIETSVQASGMSQADLRAIEQAAGGAI